MGLLTDIGFGGVDSLIGLGTSAWQVDRSSDMADHAMDFSGSQSALNRDFQERMSGSSYQRGVEDMKKAGLNPMLAYSQGGASSPSGSAGAGVAGAAALPHPTNVAINSAQVANTQADTNLKNKQADEVVARTPTHGQSIENSVQQISESKKRMEVMSTEMMRNVSSAGHAEQQISNLQAQLPNIRAEYEKIWAAVENMKANTSEVNQRVKQNLPQIERALKDLQKYMTELGKPKAEQDFGVHDGFMGAFSAVLRSLTGLGTLSNIGR